MKYISILALTIVFMIAISLSACFPYSSYKKVYICSSETQNTEENDAKEGHNQSGEIVFISVIV